VDVTKEEEEVLKIVFFMSSYVSFNPISRGNNITEQSSLRRNAYIASFNLKGGLFNHEIVDYTKLTSDAVC